MDELLAKAGSQAVTFAIRSGISLASTVAIKTISNFLSKLPEDDNKNNLKKTKEELQTRIRIVTPAIDLLQLVAARGNTSLDSTLKLTSILRDELEEFDIRVAELTESIDVDSNSISGSKTKTKLESKGKGKEKSINNGTKHKTRLQSKHVTDAITNVENYMNDLLIRIEKVIPLITLSLTTSGANLSASLPTYVSPGRLLQASNYVIEGDKKFEKQMRYINKRNYYNQNERNLKDLKVQIGPTFTLVMYSIFHNPTRSTTEIIWREEFAKCNVRIFRIPINVSKSKSIENINNSKQHSRNSSISSTPKSINSIYNEQSINELTTSLSQIKLQESNSNYKNKLKYSYILSIEEDFNDGRYHDENDNQIIKEIDVSVITKLFFSAAGKLLKIEESKSPVLVLKINQEYIASSIDDENYEVSEDNINSQAFNVNDILESDNEDGELNESKPNPGSIEWIAFEQYDIGESYEDNDVEDDDHEYYETIKIGRDQLGSSLSPKTPSRENSIQSLSRQCNKDNEYDQDSLSLLEYILRLTALQSNDQTSLLQVHDERLSLYLHDENSTTKAENNKQSQAQSSQSGMSKGTPTATMQRRVSNSGNNNNRSTTIQSSWSSHKVMSVHTPKTENKRKTDMKLQSSPAAITPEFEDDIFVTPQSRVEQKEKGSHIPGSVYANKVLTPWEKDRKKHRDLVRLMSSTPMAGKLHKNGYFGGNNDLRMRLKAVAQIAIGDGSQESGLSGSSSRSSSSSGSRNQVRGERDERHRESIE